jgi:excisionase family DNA binding protein
MDMLTAQEVAKWLRLSARKVYSLAASGELASHRFGGAVRFSTADVDAYIAACRCPTQLQGMRRPIHLTPTQDLRSGGRLYLDLSAKQRRRVEPSTR